ncbi:MAG: heavy-metal-associated domain-containing protein [Halodesulfurarchaeum sp.]
MSITLRVEEMSCEGCEDIVETALEEVSGVESASADREAGTADVEGDSDVEELIEAVDYAGYTAELDQGAGESAGAGGEEPPTEDAEADE